MHNKSTVLTHDTIIEKINICLHYNKEATNVLTSEHKLHASYYFYFYIKTHFVFCP